MRTQVPLVSLQASLAEVIDATVSTHLNRAVVIDEQHHIAGIVTNTELMRRLGERPGIVTSLMRRAAAALITKNVKVTDVMVSDILTTRPGVEVETAMQEMVAQKRKILP